MNRPQVINSSVANQHIKIGIDTIVNLLAPTIGPISGFVVNETTPSRRPEILEDSATIARRIVSLGTPQKDIGAMLVRNLVWQMGELVGDGGAMAAVLTRAIYEEGLKLINAGANPVLLTQGVETAVSKTINALHAQATAVSTEDELAALALTIVGNRPLAAAIGEMSYLLGPDAYISTHSHIAPHLECRYIAGAQYAASIASMHLYTDTAQKRALLNNTLVAVSHDPLTQIEQVVPLLEAALQRQQKALTIIAPQITDTVIGLLMTNRKALKDRLTVTAVILTATEQEKQDALHDIGLLTGASILGRPGAHTATQAKPHDLGYAQRIDLSNNTLIVIGDRQKETAVQIEVGHLRQRLNSLSKDNAQRVYLRKRLAALTGGIGELKIGAHSQYARKLYRQQAERAFNVLASAQQNGVVAGGGAAFIHCDTALKTCPHTGDAAIGFQMIRRTLPVIMRQILRNAHTPNSDWLLHQLSQKGAPTTINVLTGQTVDAHQSGILDALDTVVAILKTAASGAMIALKTDTIVYRKNPPQSIGLNP